jgi:uncharacterized protein YjlB
MRIEDFLLTPSEGIPNNPALPVIVYHRALAGETELAKAFEARFLENGWQGCWRNGVYSYQHYHTHAHEVLGIARGEACLLIGGPDGRKIEVSAGDCLLLPAGTGHCRISADPDFLVIGAYPPGQEADIRTEPAREEDFAAIRAVALPKADPIEGRGGAASRLLASR